MRVALVGSGPSALFAAGEFLRRSEAVGVDFLERLPAPFGLLRYGVAPDHAKIKSLTRTLSRVFSDSRVRFLGNVTVGVDVSFDELRSAYDAVVVATGATRPRRLGVPGEALRGSYSAADLVAWYNGHPYDGTGWAGDPGSVAVIGAGNVALDVARILLKGGTALADTDVPEPVRAALDRNRPRHIHVIARRGVHDVRFSMAELLELENLDGVDIVVDPASLPTDDPDHHATRTRSEIFRRWASRAPGGGRRLSFHFHRVPVELIGTGEVAGLRLRHATAPGVTESLAVQAVVAAVGHLGEPVPGLPFDAVRGVVPHEDGRVAPGIYVTGWIKRGPSGVVGTNKACAAHTVGTVLADLAHESRPPVDPAAREALLGRLDGRSDPARRPVSWTGWQAIDRAEIALGTRHRRPRIKIADAGEMLEIAAASR